MYNFNAICCGSPRCCNGQCCCCRQLGCCSHFPMMRSTEKCCSYVNPANVTTEEQTTKLNKLESAGIWSEVAASSPSKTSRIESTGPTEAPAVAGKLLSPNGRKTGSTKPGSSEAKQPENHEIMNHENDKSSIDDQNGSAAISKLSTPKGSSTGSTKESKDPVPSDLPRESGQGSSRRDWAIIGQSPDTFSQQKYLLNRPVDCGCKKSSAKGSRIGSIKQQEPLQHKSPQESGQGSSKQSLDGVKINELCYSSLFKGSRTKSTKEQDQVSTKSLRESAQVSSRLNSRVTKQSSDTLNKPAECRSPKGTIIEINDPCYFPLSKGSRPGSTKEQEPVGSKSPRENGQGNSRRNPGLSKQSLDIFNQKTNYQPLKSLNRPVEGQCPKGTTQPKQVDNQQTKAEKALEKIKPKRKCRKSKQKTVSNTQPKLEENNDLWFDCNIPIRVSLPTSLCLGTLFNLMPSTLAKCISVSNSKSDTLKDPNSKALVKVGFNKAKSPKQPEANTKPTYQVYISLQPMCYNPTELLRVSPPAEASLPPAEATLPPCQPMKPAAVPKIYARKKRSVKAQIAPKQSNICPCCKLAAQARQRKCSCCTCLNKTQGSGTSNMSYRQRIKAPMVPSISIAANSSAINQRTPIDKQIVHNMPSSILPFFSHSTIRQRTQPNSIGSSMSSYHNGVGSVDVPQNNVSRSLNIQYNPQPIEIESSGFEEMDELDRRNMAKTPVPSKKFNLFNQNFMKSTDYNNDFKSNPESWTNASSYFEDTELGTVLQNLLCDFSPKSNSEVYGSQSTDPSLKEPHKNMGDKSTYVRTYILNASSVADSVESNTKLEESDGLQKLLASIQVPNLGDEPPKVDCMPEDLNRQAAKSEDPNQISANSIKKDECLLQRIIDANNEYFNGENILETSLPRIDQDNNRTSAPALTQDTQCTCNPPKIQTINIAEGWPITRCGCGNIPRPQQNADLNKNAIKNRLRPRDLKLCLLRHENSDCLPTVVEYDVTAFKRLPEGHPFQSGGQDVDTFDAIEKDKNGLSLLSEDNIEVVLDDLKEFCQQTTPNSKGRPKMPVILMPIRLKNGEMIAICQPDEWREIHMQLPCASTTQKRCKGAPQTSFPESSNTSKVERTIKTQVKRKKSDPRRLTSKVSSSIKRITNRSRSPKAKSHKTHPRSQSKESVKKSKVVSKETPKPTNILMHSDPHKRAQTRPHHTNERQSYGSQIVRIPLKTSAVPHAPKNQFNAFSKSAQCDPNCCYSCSNKKHPYILQNNRAEPKVSARSNSHKGTSKAASMARSICSPSKTSEESSYHTVSRKVNRPKNIRSELKVSVDSSPPKQELKTSLKPSDFSKRSETSIKNAKDVKFLVKPRRLRSSTTFVKTIKKEIVNNQNPLRHRTVVSESQSKVLNNSSEMSIPQQQKTVVVSETNKEIYDYADVLAAREYQILREQQQRFLNELRCLQQAQLQQQQFAQQPARLNEGCGCSKLLLELQQQLQQQQQQQQHQQQQQQQQQQHQQQQRHYEQQQHHQYYEQKQQQRHYEHQQQQPQMQSHQHQQLSHNPKPSASLQERVQLDVHSQSQFYSQNVPRCSCCNCHPELRALPADFYQRTLAKYGLQKMPGDSLITNVQFCPHGCSH